MKEGLPAAGTVISDYRILSPLDAGGMGEVYLAEDTQLDRKVAIKFLPAESVADEQAKKRLVREAKAAAKLDHPHICSIYEVGEEDGRSFIVMQYIEGEPMKESRLAGTKISRYRIRWLASLFVCGRFLPSTCFHRCSYLMPIQ